jgi:hypothetical protein
MRVGADVPRFISIFISRFLLGWGHLVGDDGLAASLSYRFRTASLPLAANRGPTSLFERARSLLDLLDSFDCLEQKRVRLRKNLTRGMSST